MPIKGKNKLKIAVAMSGGVDSSVAAALLKRQGRQVVGIFLHFWKEDVPPDKGGVRGVFENKCCSLKALTDARRVADKIGIPLYVLNFSEIFKKQVVDNFLSQYQSGLTPNPCVRCNKLVKLGWLLRQAKKLGFDYVATGHYVISKKTRKQENKKIIYKLFKAKDKTKDQSYFLYTLNQAELKHLLFPLGGYTKPQVRRLAKKLKLPVAEKPDSQEICFIPEKNHNEFLRRHLKLRPGLIKTFGGKILGHHQGLPLYTIGQRKGIEIGGTGPYYAAKMDYKTNILYVVNDGHDKRLYKKSLMAKQVNWLSPVELPLNCSAVIRYRHKPVACQLAKSGGNCRVRFKELERAITPGQSVVFYQGEKVLGGGIIK